MGEEFGASPSLGEQTSSILKIQNLLKTKDDTTRFVGLALLKSVLDNSEGIRSDENSIRTLWESVPAKFLDRLLRTHQGQRRDMTDLAVSVLHTFTSLLPAGNKDEKLIGRVPRLVGCLVHSSDDTTRLALETLLSLVSQPEGAKCLAQLEDLSPLTETAPSQQLALDVLCYAWLNSIGVVEDRPGLIARINQTVADLVVSFKGTDAVTLLEFLANLLRGLQAEIIPEPPKWLSAVVDFIRSLVTNRPTAAARSAYTNISALLLELYPARASQLLFSNDGGNADKPFSYLLINLLLVDLRSSFPVLLEQLNSPGYAANARRLTSDFDVISNFIGYLLRSMDNDGDEDNDASLQMPPDLLLKMRKSISETMSVTIEYLRDRWDASVAGAMGLHPDARTGTSTTAPASRLPLAWDSKGGNTVDDDPLVLAAIRALSIWLREDDNETLRGEAAGLTDMLVELYRSGGSNGGGSGNGVPEHLDMRRPILVAFEGTTATEDGVDALLDHDGWNILTTDLLAILSSSSTLEDEPAAARGVEIVRVLLPIVEAEQPGPREAWLDVVTRVAGWGAPDGPPPQQQQQQQASSPVVAEFQVAVLQLVVALLAGAHAAMRRRYVHSARAVAGIAEHLRGRIGEGTGREEMLLREELEDVLGALEAMR